MVKNTIGGLEDASVLELEFRHNAYNTTNNALYHGFACFDLKPFRQENKDSIPITIKVKDWDGEKTFELMYKYNEMNKGTQLMSIPNITTNEFS